MKKRKMADDFKKNVQKFWKCVTRVWPTWRWRRWCLLVSPTRFANITFHPWQLYTYPCGHSLAERCLDEKTKRRKYKKTQNTKRDQTIKKESSIFWCQGSFTLLGCYWSKTNYWQKLAMPILPTINGKSYTHGHRVSIQHLLLAMVTVSPTRRESVQLLCASHCRTGFKEIR